MVKKVCILTKSVKDRGYCVAGIDVENGEWVRLVNSKDGDAIPKEIMDEESNPIEVLDVIAVELKGRVPRGCQTENWLIDKKSPILKMESLTLNDILKIKQLDRPDYVFINDKSELTVDEVKRLKYSLLFIEARDLVFDTSMKGDGRHHHKVSFTYNGTEYTACLTDPQFRKEELDDLPVIRAFLVVSIPAVSYENDLFYKFVAKIFTAKL